MARSHVVLITAALFHAQGYAHHSNSIYDMGRDVSIEGTIVRLAWANPHVYFWVEEAGDDGERVVWEIEAPPPPILRRLGWAQGTFGIGDAVTVGGKRGRDPARDILLMRSLEKPGSGLPALGEEAFNSLAQPDSERSAQATGLDGTWLTLLNREVLASLSPDNLPLTDAGKEAGERFEEVDRQALSCTESSPPTQMLSADLKSIEVRDDVVIIRAEFDASQRTVRMNEDSHEGAVDSVQGHSIGRWEDDGTLVIDTARIASQGASSAPGSSSETHLVERLRLSEDRTHLLYSFELEDPEHLTAPITGEGIRLMYRPDLELEAVPCDIENAGRFAE